MGFTKWWERMQTVQCLSSCDGVRSQLIPSLQIVFTVSALHCQERCLGRTKLGTFVPLASNSLTLNYNSNIEWL